jgi:hypothetical protein
VSVEPVGGAVIGRCTPRVTCDGPVMTRDPVARSALNALMEMAPRPAPIAASAHRPTILRAPPLVSARAPRQSVQSYRSSSFVEAERMVGLRYGPCPGRRRSPRPSPPVSPAILSASLQTIDTARTRVKSCPRVPGARRRWRRCGTKRRWSARKPLASWLISLSPDLTFIIGSCGRSEIGRHEPRTHFHQYWRALFAVRALTGA